MKSAKSVVGRRLALVAIWRSPADTLAYRDTEEARLAPIIEASGARVD